MIVIDISSIVGAATRPDGIPRRAFDEAFQIDQVALSVAVWREISDVLHRPKFRNVIRPAVRTELIEMLLRLAVWFEPSDRVTDCRDTTDDKYLELALAAAAHTIISSDNDLLVLHPWRGVRILSPAQFLAAPRP